MRVKKGSNRKTSNFKCDTDTKVNKLTQKLKLLFYFLYSGIHSLFI